ncbi:hypothetical protein NQ315_009636 [Exocentrus adspersus]|uniref:CHK kinase-like domain-containing protein n=1 Tax=Exocentrus adspersus TaxID=1586481 RepID=A0AAV8WH63_9CUCU|nr:hypothetical protein NQ315_009636 [Exocentrus adspersus]
MPITDDDIKTYIREAFDNQNLSSCEITLTGSNEKTDGYASFINFATVSTTTKDGTREDTHIAVKVARESLLQSFRYAFERESYIYSTILPKFNAFQKENKVAEVFSSFPKCYKTVSDEKVELIIMDDLKKKGYELYDRKKPMDLDHLKLVLQEYAKLHAIPFALRHKKKEEFKQLVGDFKDNMITIFDDSWRRMLAQGFEKAGGVMKEKGKLHLYQMCEGIIKKNAGDMMMELLTTEEPVSAILHGDCWNNNFLFEYKVENSTRIPLQVAIVDWQLSRLHSPVVDLSYFLYSTSSEEQLEHFDELLEVYYESFSKCIEELGCDPEQLFPMSTLKSHWKKYSLYGLFMVVLCLHVMMSDKEETADIDVDSDNSEERNQSFMDMKIKNVGEYHKRLAAVLGHYYEYTKQ